MVDHMACPGQKDLHFFTIITERCNLRTIVGGVCCANTYYVGHKLFVLIMVFRIAWIFGGVNIFPIVS